MSIFLHFVLFLLAGATGLGHPAGPAHFASANVTAQSHHSPNALDTLEPTP